MRSLRSCVLVTAALVLLIIGSAIEPRTGAADSPVVFTLTGNLTQQFGTDDPFDLEGASLMIVYDGADTTDTPTSTVVGGSFAVSFFDIFTMTVDIRGRPNGASDILGLTKPNDPQATNFFPPSSGNDAFFACE